MDEFSTPAIVPAATAGNLTNLVAERAWFEPQRIMLSRPLGDGWQGVSAREFEEEVRTTAKGLMRWRSRDWGSRRNYGEDPI
jgi:long-chain acyl-CoA synthetase